MELALRISPPLHAFPARQRVVEAAVGKHVDLRLFAQPGPSPLATTRHPPYDLPNRGRSEEVQV
jgi:hypothetical protein